MKGQKHMKDMRCVHLDFHTSPYIPVGEDFDKEEFKAAIREAELDSITLFAKCHHGCFYYPSDKFYTHPLLKKPLLDLQVEACKELGISYKIYISAGLDEAAVHEHPEWLTVFHGGTHQNPLTPNFHRFCFNTGYIDYLIDQTIEITKRYMPDGLFFDIIGLVPCVCAKCRKDMAEKGLDFRKIEDTTKFATEVQKTWIKKITDAARAIKPDTMVFFNGGDFPIGIHHLMDCNNQLEAESLPTGGWGYDHFPMSMSYIRRQGKNCIGMTGKFHKTWGEFGGFKYKEALLYEGAQCLAFDAGLSVGDQLHPTGKIDSYTYENIGNAMRYIKAREPWRGGDFIAEIAVLSDLLPNSTMGDMRQLGRTGVCRMLFEEKYLFDLIGYEEISNKYKFIILADEQNELNEVEYKALRAYVDAGGKIIATAKAPLYQGKMAFDLGAEFVGPDKASDPKTPAFLRTDYKTKSANGMAMVIYEPFYEIKLTGKKLGDYIAPYFHRRDIYFCSHNNTPCNYDTAAPGITEGSEGVYVCAEILTDYSKCGSLAPKQIMAPLFAKYCENKTVNTTLPSSGKVALYEKDGSYMLHLVYANTIKRGNGIEVIEDLVTLSDVEVSLKLPKKVTKAILHPEEKEIAITEKDGRISFTLDKLYCSSIVELK